MQVRERQSGIGDRGYKSRQSPRISSHRVLECFWVFGLVYPSLALFARTGATQTAAMVLVGRKYIGIGVVEHLKRSGGLGGED